MSALALVRSYFNSYKYKYIFKFHNFAFEMLSWLSGCTLVQRLCSRCSGPGLVSTLWPFAACHPLSLSLISCPTLQLSHQE